MLSVTVKEKELIFDGEKRLKRIVDEKQQTLDTQKQVNRIYPNKRCFVMLLLIKFLCKERIRATSKMLTIKITPPFFCLYCY